MVIVGDDPIDNFTSSTEAVRESTQEKFDLLTELLEPGGYLTLVGTPYVESDLYSVLLDRAQKPGAKPLLSRIDPAWTVLHHARHKEILDLEPQDVSLLFPERLTFENLRAAALDSASDNFRLFRMQKLCEWVEEGETEKLNFSRDKLRERIVQADLIPAMGEINITVDRAYSTSKTADLSSICVSKCALNAENVMSLYVLTVEADRWKGSELAEKLALLAQRNNPVHILIEQGADWQSLDELIRQAFAKYGVSTRPYWRTPSGTKNEKFVRFKALEHVLYGSRLFFKAGPYIDMLFDQFTTLDGKGKGFKSTASKKDDCVDSLSMALWFCKNVPDLEDVKKIEEEQRKQTLLREQYNAYFVTPSIQTPQIEEAPSNSPYSRFHIPGIRPR